MRKMDELKWNFALPVPFQPVDLLPFAGLPSIGTCTFVFVYFASREIACMKL
jgi:hypothetical protein